MLLEAFVEKNEPIMETGYKIPMSSGFYIVENSHFYMTLWIVYLWPSRNKIVFTSSRKTKILTTGIHHSILRIEIFV